MPKEEPKTETAKQNTISTNKKDNKATVETEAVTEAVIVPLKEAKKGDIITFGNYYQGKTSKKRKKPIEWQVLDKKDNKVLVISKSALEVQQYNFNKSDVTWETCYLRAWLNNRFYDEAFSKEEKEKIIETTVKADPNPEYSTPQGNDTVDKLFLLSLTELNKYFKTADKRKCTITPYAAANGGYSSLGFSYWLRTMGKDSIRAVKVHGEYGSVDHADCVWDGSISVRPALWLNVAD